MNGPTIFWSFSFFPYLIFIFHQCRTYTLRTYSPNVRASDACRWSQITNQNTRRMQGQASLNLWSSECQGHRRGQHRIEQRHTFSPRIEIKSLTSVPGRRDKRQEFNRLRPSSKTLGYGPRSIPGEGGVEIFFVFNRPI